MDAKRIAALFREQAELCHVIADAFEAKPPGPRTKRRKAFVGPELPPERKAKAEALIRRLGYRT